MPDTLSIEWASVSLVFIAEQQEMGSVFYTIIKLAHRLIC